MASSSNSHLRTAPGGATSWAHTDRDELLAAVAHEAGHPVAATTPGVLIGATPETVLAIAHRNSIRIHQLTDAASAGFAEVFRPPAGRTSSRPAAAA